MSGQRGYIVGAIKDYLTTNKIIDADTLEAGGYRITTTLQKSKQDAFVKAVNDQVMSKLDKKSRKVDNYVRAGGASVDPKTGNIVAMYGGIDYVKQYTNGATRGDFQVGSTFKPFVLASAIQNDSQTQDGQTITPNTYYDGTNKRPVEGWNGGSYAPENEDQASYGDITVRTATDKSVNSVYAQMAVDVGPDKVKQTAIDLGIPSDTPDLTATPSIALGPSTASVLDMAEAYATLANHGERHTYTMISKITKDGTDEIKLPGPEDHPRGEPRVRRHHDLVLQSVVDNGTATAAQAADRPAAGKTGTAEEDTAAWFAGYTPDLATVVSVMGQDPTTAAHKSLYGAMGLERVNGGGAPAEIWAQFTKSALKGTEASDFDLQLQEGAETVAPPSIAALPAGDDGRPGQRRHDHHRRPGDQGQTQGGTTDGGTTTTDGGTTTTTGGTTGTTTTGGTTTDGGTTTTDGGTTGTTTTTARRRRAARRGPRRTAPPRHDDRGDDGGPAEHGPQEGVTGGRWRSSDRRSPSTPRRRPAAETRRRSGRR
jgi:membrane peptidoglycan carboxypeptidase